VPSAAASLEQFRDAAEKGPDQPLALSFFQANHMGIVEHVDIGERQHAQAWIRDEFGGRHRADADAAGAVAASPVVSIPSNQFFNDTVTSLAQIPKFFCLKASICIGRLGPNKAFQSEVQVFRYRAMPTNNQHCLRRKFQTSKHAH
jgi:hypothetical protein